MEFLGLGGRKKRVKHKTDPLKKNGVVIEVLTSVNVGVPGTLVKWTYDSWVKNPRTGRNERLVEEVWELADMLEPAD